MKRFSLCMVFMIALQTWGAAAPVDGKVEGLNAEVFDLVKSLSSFGRLSETHIKRLCECVMKDGRLDEQEMDLLEELTEHKLVEPFWVRKQGHLEEKTLLYPVYGPACQLIKDVLHPPFDYEAAWQAGQEGFNKIVAEYGAQDPKDPAKHDKAPDFLTDKLQVAWRKGGKETAYKPLRDQLAILWAFSSKSDRVNLSQELIYRAMLRLDVHRESNNVPDFLYKWMAPKGYIPPERDLQDPKEPRLH